MDREIDSIEINPQCLGLINDDKWGKDKVWLFKVGIVKSGVMGSFSVDYRVGIGLSRNYNNYRKGFTGSVGLLPPIVDKVDLLESLLLDCHCAEGSFQDFCSEFGYNTDSRKALETYLLCGEIKQKMLGININIDKLRKELGE